MKFRFVFQLLLGLMFLGMVTPLPAQDSASSSPQNRQQQGALRPAGGRFRAARSAIADVLTREQRASLQHTLRAQRENLRTLATRLRRARADLLAAGLNGNFDDKMVRRKALTVARLQAQLSVLRLKAFSEIRPPLSREQVRQLRALMQPAVHRPGPNARMPGRGAGAATSDTNGDENGLPPKH